MDYRRQFFQECLPFAGDLSGSSVLVVGCGPGLDCVPFVAAGASVTGLDICDDIGVACPEARYCQASIEDSGLPSDRFDMISCIATMEHVGGIERAFAEMVRLVRPGGLVYSVAAPLWNSRRGHHFDCLNPFPWIHLRMKPEQIIEFGERRGITHNGTAMRDVVNYVFDFRYFNRAPASRYVEACRELPVTEILRNDLWQDGTEELTPEIRQELKDYSRDELLTVSHTLVARK
jgi:SAM-dependent methyltransferase